MSLPQLVLPQFNMTQLQTGRVLRTAAVLVEVVERVEACLLLLFSLERVAGLEIRVLHDHNTGGPAENDWTPGKEKKKAE